VKSHHRRLLALFLSLVGMALASSAAHAGPLCEGVPGSVGSLLCGHVTPPDSIWETAPALLTADLGDPLPGAAGGTILLGGQSPAGESARPSDRLLDVPLQGDDETVVSAR